jgi:hypothetical protein
MLGLDYQSRINLLLSESSGSQWIDLKGSFDFMYEAAKDFAKETKCCTNSQAITTVANQAAYPLNPDFLEVLTTDDDNFGLVQYNTGTISSPVISWLGWESYSNYLQNNNSPGTPTSHAIADYPIVIQITGSTTNSSTATGGQSSLIDSVQTLFSTVAVGDDIIDVTNNYFGKVLAVSTSLTTAMFNISTRSSQYVGWANGVSYIIQPQPRYQIFLDPAPTTTGQIITVPYYAKPLPVYSDYGMYPFATGYEEALLKYSAWLYRYRDSKPQFADPLYMAYDKALRKAKNVHRKAVGALGFRVNFISPNPRSWT